LFYLLKLKNSHHRAAGNFKQPKMLNFDGMWVKGEYSVGKLLLSHKLPAK
jgi:hypothetical protein